MAFAATGLTHSADHLAAGTLILLAMFGFTGGVGTTALGPSGMLIAVGAYLIIHNAKLWLGVLDEEQVDVDLHLPADRIATAGQLHLPVEPELAAIQDRVKLDAGDLAERGLPRRGVLTDGRDRASDPADRELTVDLGAAVVMETHRG
jgi:hypothetical protein